MTHTSLRAMRESGRRSVERTTMRAASWTVTRQDIEGKTLDVFRSPDGHYYKRAGKGDSVDYEYPMKTPGIAPLQLTNIDHWVGA